MGKLQETKTNFTVFPILPIKILAQPRKPESRFQYITHINFTLTDLTDLPVNY